MTEKQLRNVKVFDIETLFNCFTYTDIDIDTEEIKQFVVWKNRNDFKDLLNYLNSVKGLIGFNSLAFDYPVIHFMITNSEKLLKLSNDRLAKAIYKQAQFVIKQEWSQIREPLIHQLDLFAIHHFNNPARMTSLKKLQISLGFENVQDMPIHHTDEIKTDEEVQMVLDYNLNDVKATRLFYDKTIDKIELRKGIQKEYGVNCISLSDSKIGEELMLKLYCEATGQSPGVIKKRRTFRHNFKFSDCIPSYIEFKTDEFKDLLEYLRGIEVTELKDSFHYEFEYKGLTYHLGTGGIHACIKEGIYKSNDESMIVDADVGSLYPSLAVVNKFYPNHLGAEFCSVYEGLVNQRLAAKKSGNKTMADGLKLSLNSVYGKSNSEYSWLCDPLYTLKTTLAGQLSLCMLCEMLHNEIKDLVILQVNTDGITVVIKKEDKRRYWEICQEWEVLSKLNLEYISYEKMIIRDVNNYLSIGTDGKIKRKGVFKTHDEMKKDGEWYKAFNQGIVPIALSEYFINGKSVEETVKSCKEIYKFTKNFNCTHGWTSETFNLTDQGEEIDLKKEQKTSRYFVSNEGKIFRKRKDALKPKYNKDISAIKKDELEVINSLYNEVELKVNEAISNNIITSAIEAEVKISCPIEIYRVLNRYDTQLNYIYSVNKVVLEQSEVTKIQATKAFRLIEIEAGGSMVAIFNKYEDKPIEEYNINYDFYIGEVNKIIDLVEGTKEQRELRIKLEKEKQQKSKWEEDYIMYCINRQPTERMYNLYKKDFLIEKYGEITEFKKINSKKDKK